MTDNIMTLFCLADGEATPFSIEVDRRKTVEHLKDLIKTEKSNDFSDIDADKLTLWHVSIPITEDDESPILLNFVTSEKEKLGPADDISEVFEDQPPQEIIHIIVQRPRPATPPPHRGPRPRVLLSSEKCQELFVQIESDFFAPDSRYYKRLVQFLKADRLIPTTGGLLGGLPSIAPRAGLIENRPSLLFLNLPESPETQDPPSTADNVLERIRGQSIPLVPLFGVSGCGKTRTAIEMLSKNWGFYFNGSETDLGSNDLAFFLRFVEEKKRYRGLNLDIETLVLVLVLTRIIILHHCIDIAKREGITFTCKDWMLLQVGFRTMGIPDLFYVLFQATAPVIHRYSVDISIMSAFVQKRFSNLRDRLLDLTPNTPNAPFKRSGYRILLVIDDAQNLGNMREFGTFASQPIPPEIVQQAEDTTLYDYMPPVLSPFVHGLCSMSTDINEICVIPCGSALSIFDVKWLEDSNGYNALLGPYTDFQGWNSLEQVQSYRDLVRRSLPSDEARIIFDTRVPDESIPELFTRLRGRFRPIVSTIERMIIPNKGIMGWRRAIEETETMLISTERNYQFKGNIVYDITRMISRVDRFKERYMEYLDIRTVLQFFVLRHYLHGRAAILNTEEAPLVECSVGRIVNVANETRTVLDEPFTLRAVMNYFLRDDPDFHNSIRSWFNCSAQEEQPPIHQMNTQLLFSEAHIAHMKRMKLLDRLRDRLESVKRKLEQGCDDLADYHVATQPQEKRRRR